MKKFVVFLIVIILFRPVLTDAAMSGGSYEIYADSIGISEANLSTGGTYALFETTGDSFASSTTGGAYVANGGFQAAEKGILSFSLSGSTVNLNTLNVASVSTASLVATISTDSRTGYTLSLTEDGNLRSGANDIDDVADGSVTAGAEEYGIQTVGSDGLLASATPISGTVAVASASGDVTNHQTEIDFKAAISSATVDGSYSHQITFTVTVNP